MNKDRKMPIVEQNVLLALIFFFPIVVAVIFGQQKDTFTTDDLPIALPKLCKYLYLMIYSC